jgi:hypothetical protein
VAECIRRSQFRGAVGYGVCEKAVEEIENPVIRILIVSISRKP